MGHGSTTRASVKGQCFSCNVSWLLTSVLHVSFFTVSRWSDGWHTNTINFIWAALALHTFLRQFSCESGGPDMSWEETEQQWMNFLSQRKKRSDDALLSHVGCHCQGRGQISCNLPHHASGAKASRFPWSGGEIAADPSHHGPKLFETLPSGREPPSIWSKKPEPCETASPSDGLVNKVTDPSCLLALRHDHITVTLQLSNDFTLQPTDW